MGHKGLFRPQEINEDSIENLCEDLRCALVTLYDNEGGDEEDYDNAIMMLRQLDALADELHGPNGNDPTQ